jgi:DnaK suppressor protein
MVDYDNLYERLKKEKTQISEKLEQLKAREQPPGERREGSPFGKREEEASEVFELEKRLALEQKLRATLAEINHALKKYEAGSYGLCDSCGQPIEHDRLEALPQASLCLSCKARQAKNAKGAG